MKVNMFHLMPHRELPDDFEEKYHSVWIDPPWSELADPVRVGQYYNWTLDELEYAAEMGFDGVCVNEHHQNAYGFMPSPNIMASTLARNTKDAAIVVMGATLPAANPPQRIAEEYAMIDVISGGRLVAGMPLGSSPDINYAYGIPPIEQRERYREAHDLIKQAWEREDVFAFNGKYTQLRYVNTWPKPIQKNPPIWVPGTGSKSTVDFVVKHGYCYCFLSYFGNKVAKKNVDKYWDRLDELGEELNPYRLGFLQLVVVGETDAKAEEDYFKHIKYFYDKSLHIDPNFFLAPGHVDHASLVGATRAGGYGAGMFDDRSDWTFKNYVDNQFVIGGSPDSVAQQLEEAVRTLRVGNLMVLLQIGSMPHELTKKNIALFAEEVLPKVRPIWDAEGWENKWWPSGARQATLPTVSAR